MSSIDYWDQNGALQFSSNVMTFAFIGSGTVTSAGVSGMGVSETSRFTIPGSAGRIVAIAGGGGHQFAFSGTRPSPSDAVFATTAPAGTTFKYYLFDVHSVLSATGTGLELWDDFGQLTFSSNYKQLRSLAILQSGGLSSHTAWGRQLAVAQMVFCGYLQYSNEEKETDGWYYDQDFSLYGASITDSGQTASLGIVPYGVGRYGPFPRMPTNAFDKPATMMVVDVTGLP